LIASAGKRMMGKTPFLNLECINTKIGYISGWWRPRHAWRSVAIL